MTKTMTPIDCVTQVEQHFGPIVTELERVRSEVAALFEAGPVTTASLRERLEPGSLEFLRNPNLIGGGFVVAPGVLTDRRLYLVWWQGEERDFLGDADAPGTGEAIDYTRQPWYRTPERTGELTLVGPYVDFVCTDEYVMTTTMPVYVDGRMVGVAGADTLVETLETMLLPGLREAGATLVNGHGKAIVSADPQLATGSPLTTARDMIPCRGLPLSVALS
ncbi:cache domain-containing protein [Nocardioides sp. NPDC101246]|uniref:cache domain-containing protein n=1 Tax=Nocardioides sp. NPDC101246 TaxID=3364336 RepID=UPI00382933B3